MIYKLTKQRRKVAFLVLLLASSVACQQAMGGAIVRTFFDNFGLGVTGTTIDELVAASDWDRDGGTFPEVVGSADGVSSVAFDNRAGGTNLDDGIDNFGSITRGYIQSPVTGPVTFYVGSDDNSELYIGPDHNVIPFRDPDSLVAFETDWTNGNIFTTARLDERSGTLELEKGKWYYVELLQKEGAGGSFISVGWELPDGTQELIPGGALAPYGSSFDHTTRATSLEVVGPPQTQDVVEKNPVTFSATFYGPQPATFQWLKNGQPIDGETLAWLTLDTPTLADNGSQYSVRITSGGQTVTTAAGVLNVLPDTVAPTVEDVIISNLDPNKIRVVFSETVETASAQRTANYVINNGVTTESATLLADGRTVQLVASGITDAQTGYNLTVNGVRDLSSSPNPNEPATVELVLFPGGLVQDNNGFVVFEAENFDEIVGESWVVDTERGNPSGGASVVHPNGAPGGESASQLLYHINFNRTGRHIVWYSASGDNGSDDSAWLHLNGERPPERSASNDAAMTGFANQMDFVWRSDSFGGADPMDFNLSTAGQHVVGLARREDGSFFDKFIITTDENYDPDTDDDGFNRPETRSAGEPLPNPEIVINQGPQDTEGVVGRNVTFSVDASVLSDGQPTGQVIITWAVNGEDVDGGGSTLDFGPLKPSHDGAQVQAVVRMPGLRVVTEPATLSVVAVGIGTLSPENGDSNVRIDLPSISAVVNDTETLTVNNVSMVFNGASVTTTSTKANGSTTVVYELPGLLPGDTEIEVQLNIGTVQGETASFNYSFRTESAALIVPSQWASPTGSGSDSGFSVRSVQAAVDAALPNNIDRAEAQLADPPTPPAEHTGTDFPLVIDYDQTGGAQGFFRGAETSMSGVGLMGSHTDQTSMEILTYLELPAGLVRMGVNTDDGFRVTVGPTSGSTALQVGAHNGGGGANQADPQYAFKFIAQEAGVYAFRMTWWEGTGGANVEWAVKDSAGVSHLVNSDTSPIKAYRSRSSEPPSGPAIAISYPSVAQVFGAGSDIAIEADVFSDADISLVEFFADGSKLGEVTETPYRIIVPQAPVGDYLISARVTDANGATAETIPFSVSVVEGGEVVEPPPVGPQPDPEPIPGQPNIIWVSFHSGDEFPSQAAIDAGFTLAPDVDYTRLLRSQGYNVTRTSTTSVPVATELNEADLVIISRSVPSGDYQNAGASAWNNIEAPTMILGGYVLRSSRMGFTTGGTMVDTTMDVSLNANDPDHPIFTGIALGADNMMVNPFATVVNFGATLQRGVSVNTDPIDDDGNLIATIGNADDPTSGGMVIGEWQAGAQLTHDGGDGTDTLGGPRMVFLTGSREQGITSQGAGIYDLIGDGQQLFLNAVAYMLGEPVTGGGGTGATLSVVSGDGSITISWDGSGTLQSADSVNGPWTDVAGATSPHSAATSGSAGYFRVVE